MSGHKKPVTLQSGTIGKERVWIGAPTSCYEELTESISHCCSRERLHILCFTIDEAEAVIAMLQVEIGMLSRRDTP